MRFSFVAAVLLPTTTQGWRVIMSNDDGWAEINIRTFYEVIRTAGVSPIVSAPALNKSGTGSLNGTAEPVDEGCQFNSCPPNSPAIGKNDTDPRLNYVNAYPVTAMSYGISTLCPKVFHRAPDFAVSGPNVGANLDASVPFSGTVGAAVEAVNSGIPAVAFSGRTGSQTAWTANTPSYSKIYAELATNITSALLNSNSPYLPSGVWLNVNFPATTLTSCSNPSDFKFVLSRIWPAVPLLDPADVEICGSDRLPLERKVVDTSGCYASISVGNTNKLDADKDAQADVLKRLSSLLSCLP